MTAQKKKTNQRVPKAQDDKASKGLFTNWPDDAQRGQGRNSKDAKKSKRAHTDGLKSEDKLALILGELTGLLKDSPELKPVFDREIKALQNAFSATADAPPRPTPTKPLWSDSASRRNRNPSQFIREEYKAELSAGSLTRARLRMLDKALYDAYANWITPKRHPEDDLGLPKASRTNLDELNDPVEHVRKQRREIMRRWRLRN